MNEKIGTLISEECFYDLLENEISYEADNLIDAFKSVINLTDLYYDISCSQDSGAYWTGGLDLETFIKNLPKLKDEYPNIYRKLIEDYEGLINEAKRLIVKLKLQELPLPWVKVEHNNSNYYHEKTMKYSIYVDDIQQSIWDYFYDLSIEKDTDVDFKAIQIQTETYLEKVEPILVDICEMFALIAHKHLIEVSNDVSEKYFKTT